MFYLDFLILSAVEMLFEAWISARNSRELIKKGAIEIAPFLLPLMIAVYGIMFVGAAVEFHYKQNALSLSWILSFLALFLAAKALKFWAVSALGQFWTMRVLIVPESRVVTGGPYRWIRHPNYVAVLAELAAIPLLGKCWITFAIVISLFLVLLALRIRSEERGLQRHTDYSERMASRRRFL